MTRAAGAHALSGLAGRLRLRPGAPLGQSLHSSRPAGLVRALRGQPAAAVPGLLASLFSACGGVHRLGADLALQAAATGAPVQPDAAQRRLLQGLTLRSHLQALALDWPRLLADPDDATAATAGLALLAGCPLQRRPAGAPDAAALAALPAWLQSRVFHQPLTTWLAAWQADPAAALRHWADGHAADGPVARWLQRSHRVAGAPLPTVTALRPHADAATLRTLVAELRSAGSTVPRWQGRCADTGPGTRLALPPSDRSTAALRIGARLADLARLALPDHDDQPQGSRLLALGAVPLAPGAAIAWVETARGLLLQALWLAPGADGASPVLADALVLAPTDWHADPAGGWAQALAALPADAPATTLRALVAAYDPCVPCDIVPAAQPAEVAHA